MKLNLGCGGNKLTDCINIDCEESVKPDLVLDFVQNPLPYEDQSVDEVYLFHCIEHIEKRYHKQLFKEINRVLKDKHYFILSYPEFSKCVENWKTNKLGQRSFWEATIFGRQLFPSDYHVCIMDTGELKLVLEECGFTNLVVKCETYNPFNTIILAQRVEPYLSYETLVSEDLASTRIEHVHKVRT